MSPAFAADVAFTVAGGDEDLKAAIENASLLTRTEDETGDTQELLADAQADYRRILAALYDNGYFGGVISILIDGREAGAIPPLSPPDTIGRIEVSVTPGPLYRFDRADVAPVAAGTDIPDGFAIGQPASTNVIEETAAVAVEAWQATGYAKAEIADQKIIARHAQNVVSAELSIATGPRLTFGRITVAGNEDVETRRILKIAGLRPGVIYDPDEIERAERRLRRSGAFASVVVNESETIEPGNRLPLEIEVAEQTPRRFGFGAEISSIDGATLSAFWLHRNFLGGAERFRVDGEVSGLGGETGGIDYDLGLRIERPATPRADTDAYLEFGLESLDEPDFTSETAEVSLGFTRYAADDLTVSYGIGYVFSSIEGDVAADDYQMLIFPLGATLDKRNDSLDPKEGFYVDLDLTPFYGVTGTSSGAHLESDTRGYVSFGEDNRFTFAARLQLGSLIGPELEQSPTNYRFFSGGGGTVRGQDYQSLGVDVGGQKTGGRTFLGLSTELRAGVTENIEVVGFVDWGYVGRESFPDFSGDSHAGAGLGVRYKTALGPIRLDVATPVSGDTDASSYYLYLGIGQAF